jgi:hypothetical protein
MATEVKKISELTATTTANSTDYFVLVTDTSGTPSTNRLNAGRLLTQGLKARFANTTTSQLAITGDRVVIENSKTPSSNTQTMTVGSIFFDTNYLYVAVANNTIKRVALNDFS